MTFHLLPLLLSSVCQFLSRCQSATGGFTGGPGQHAHLAPTYAAVNALCIIGTEEAYNIIDRYGVPVTRWSIVGEWLHRGPGASYIILYNPL